MKTEMGRFREEKRREQNRTSQKKEDVGAPKGSKVANRFLPALFLATATGRPK